MREMHILHVLGSRSYQPFRAGKGKRAASIGEATVSYWRRGAFLKNESADLGSLHPHIPSSPPNVHCRAGFEINSGGSSPWNRGWYLEWAIGFSDRYGEGQLRFQKLYPRFNSARMPTTTLMKQRVEPLS
jgi:hypothetical protein